MNWENFHRSDSTNTSSHMPKIWWSEKSFIQDLVPHIVVLTQFLLVGSHQLRMHHNYINLVTDSKQQTFQTLSQKRHRVSALCMSLARERYHICELLPLHCPRKLTCLIKNSTKQTKLLTQMIRNSATTSNPEVGQIRFFHFFRSQVQIMF